MISESYPLEVPFFDVDSLNIVWHGHYAKYLELARCKLLDKIGYNYKDMAVSGYSFPILDMHVKYVQPITFGQHINIVATIVEWQYRLKIKYEIFDQDSGQKLTKAHTIQAAVDLNTKALRIDSPKALTDKIKPFL